MRILLLLAVFFSFIVISPAQKETKQFGQLVIEEPTYVAPPFDPKIEKEKRVWRIKQISSEIKNLQNQLKVTGHSETAKKKLQEQIDSLTGQKKSYNQLSVTASIEFAKKADLVKFNLERQKFRYVFEWLNEANQNLSKKYYREDSVHQVIKVLAVKIKPYGARLGDFSWINIRPQDGKKFNKFNIGLVDSLEQVLVECQIELQTNKNVTEIRQLRLALFPHVGAIMIPKIDIIINRESAIGLTELLERLIADSL